MEAPHPDRAVDVALAEFNALRSELVGHLTAQGAVAGIGLTALAVVAGFVVKEGGDQRLLLLVPPIALLVVLLHSAGTYRSVKIGDYIRTTLWPYLESQVGEIPSWEQNVADARRGWSAVPRVAFVDFPAMALFIIASIVALAVVADGELAWWAGCLMTVIAIFVPLVIGLTIREKAKADPVTGARPSGGQP